MDDADLSMLAAKELSSMKAGIDISVTAIGGIKRDATLPALQIVLEEGNEVVTKWNHRIDQAIQEIGDAPVVENPVLWAHYEMSRRYRKAMTNRIGRDLVIITTGQVALHYWIAAFSTMARYAKHLGFHGAAWDMTISAEEARAADERQSLLADRLLQ